MSPVLANYLNARTGSMRRYVTPVKKQSVIWFALNSLVSLLPSSQTVLGTRGLLGE